MVKVPSIKVQIRGGVRDDPGHSLNILTYDTLRPYGGGVSWKSWRTLNFIGTNSNALESLNFTK